MRTDHLFREVEPGSPRPQPRLDLDLLESVRRGPQEKFDDVEVAIALSRLVHRELLLFGTEGGETVAPNDMEEAIRTLKALLQRLGIDHDIDWRSYETFKAHWLAQGAFGSWQARRDLLSRIFDPIDEELNGLEDSLLAGTIAEPVSPHSDTGWPGVDEEIRELRRRFRTANSSQDYRAVGLLCVGVLEALSRTVYDPAIHVRPGESEPSVDKTKQRIGRFIEDVGYPSVAKKLEALIRAASDLAHAVKHRRTPTRTDAGIAADSVILLANILRRLDLPPEGEGSA